MPNHFSDVECVPKEKKVPVKPNHITFLSLFQYNMSHMHTPTTTDEMKYEKPTTHHTEFAKRNWQPEKIPSRTSVCICYKSEFVVHLSVFVLLYLLVLMMDCYCNNFSF